MSEIKRYSQQLFKSWNISKNTYLKLADISPIFKANDSTLKKNYRPVSVLNIISKLFEKLINKQFV